MLAREKPVRAHIKQEEHIPNTKLNTSVIFSMLNDNSEEVNQIIVSNFEEESRLKLHN